MKRKGISLIVLIITIVVIIILGTAIIVNIAKTNIITNANESLMKNDLATAQDAYNLYILDMEAQTKKNFIGKGRIAKNAASTTFSYKEEGQSDKEYNQTNITLADIGINSDKIDSIIIDNDVVTGIQVSNICYKVVDGRYVEIASEEYEENSIVLPENSSLVGGISKIKQSGITQISVTGIADGVQENKNYSVDAIVYNGNLVLDGSTVVEGATLENNIYEFGNSSTDVATSTTDAQNMVVLKVNGNLTINEGITLTACKSADGYGGPKGMLIYCTGTVTNNGTISMTARGARALGENVYLWQNEDESFEYVPAVGSNGGSAAKITVPKKTEGSIIGNLGDNGNNRTTAGGGSGSANIDMRLTSKSGTSTAGAGSNGTSYSGGCGGGAADGIAYGYQSTGEDASLNGGSGGRGMYNTNELGSAGGGAGNPGGALYGENGTGGLLIIYANNINNKNEITSNGLNGGTYSYTGGGGSGGGTINIFYNEIYENSGNITATGGNGGQGYRVAGGNGGTGSVSVGCIESGTYVSTYKNY